MAFDFFRLDLHYMLLDISCKLNEIMFTLKSNLFLLYPRRGSKVMEKPRNDLRCATKIDVELFIKVIL